MGTGLYAWNLCDRLTILRYSVHLGQFSLFIFEVPPNEFFFVRKF